MTDLILGMLALIVAGAAIVWVATSVANWHGRRK